MSVLFTQFAAETAEKEAEGIAALGIDPIAIVLQAGTILVLFFLVKKYASERIVTALAARRAAINESIDNARQIEQQLANVEKENEDRLAKARAEAEDIIAKSHEEAGAVMLEAEQSAQKKADQLLDSAQKQADANASKLRAEIKSEMLDLIGRATEAIIDEKVDTKKDKQLIEKALKN